MRNPHKENRWRSCLLGCASSTTITLANTPPSGQLQSGGHCASVFVCWPMDRRDVYVIFHFICTTQLHTRPVCVCLLTVGLAMKDAHIPPQRGILWILYIVYHIYMEGHGGATSATRTRAYIVCTKVQHRYLFNCIQFAVNC